MYSLLWLVGLSVSVALSATITNLDQSWKFTYTTSSQPKFSHCSVPECMITFDDSKWSNVNVPHDFIINGTFTPSADKSHGYLPYAKGWYRRTISIANTAGKTFLHFDGTQRNSVVFLNENFLGNHLSGYTPYEFDVSSYVKQGDNVLAVYIDATQPDSWWYDGGGIYRHVYTRTSGMVYIDPLSVYVPTTVTSSPVFKNSETLVANAQVHVSVSVINDNASQNFEGSVVFVVPPYSPQTIDLSVSARSTKTVSVTLSLPNVELWSLESPNLQTLTIDVSSKQSVVDSFDQAFGVRSIRFDKDQGFFLNSQPVKVKGFANHQDFAGVGVAVPDSLQKFRVSKLKDMGANAWRTAHNPPNPALLDECDRQGFLVWDENHRNIAEGGQWVDDLKAMLLRDRNHPSIIMWSLCNEVLCMNFNATSAKILKQIVKELDPQGGRPVTAAMNGGYDGPFAPVLDVIGINYHTDMYGSYHSQHPQQPMIGSEVASAFADRGTYYTSDTVKCLSSYDVNYPGWGETAEVATKAVWGNDFIAGGFTWVGFDYKGEPTPYDWPNVNSHFGVIDIAGFPKDPFYYYQSVYKPDTPLVHLFPHWNWNSGETVDVWVYSNAASIQLFLNGQDLGTKPLQSSTSPMGRTYRSHVQWSIKYEPGNLTAIGYNTQGARIASDARITTGVPKAISLEVEFPTGSLKSNGVDVALITCKIVDASGKLVPTASNMVTFFLEGSGEIIGLGNGDPNCHEHDKPWNGQNGQRVAFNGLARVVLQSGWKAGPIMLSATAPGLTSGKVSLKVA